MYGVIQQVLCYAAADKRILLSQRESNAAS